MAAITLEKLLTDVRLQPDNIKANDALVLTPMVKDGWEVLPDSAIKDEDRFLASMAAILYNIDFKEGMIDKTNIQKLVARIDEMVSDQINEILHAEPFQQMEATWTSIEDLVRNTNFRNGIDISLLDMTKEEAYEDLELNISDIAGSEIFKKIYVAEYDQFGGLPYGSLIGMYDFENTKRDILWLEAMGKIARHSHSPFIAAASPKLFGCSTMMEVNQLRDIEGLFDTPRYAGWKQLREKDVAVYLGLTMPKFMVRRPYHPLENPAEGINFEETFQFTKKDDKGNIVVMTEPEVMDQYVWGNAAMLMARNIVRSFDETGWCQYLRGVKGGGLCKGLATHTYNIRGEDELRGPVEVTIADFREYELAKAGFIPVIHRKGTAEAVFYSAQALKRPLAQQNPKDAENQQLAANMTYTFSVSRIAHYVKCIMRDNIGSNADANYIAGQIDRWIAQYVTTISNPDDLTLRYYPFKAYSVKVEEVPGKIGWYHCDLSILPHIQFEGLDVDLRVDANLAK
jgi:type VI secretion system protein ImpC